MDLSDSALAAYHVALEPVPAKDDAPPGYKRTEVGVISEDWCLRTLSSVSAFITKGATPTTYGFKWQDSGVLFLRSECVSEHGLDLAQSMFITPEARSAIGRSTIQSGDLLMTITGNVGRIVTYNGTSEASINQHIARIRITASDVDRDFVFHWLTQPLVRSAYNSITTGQAYPQISLKQVRDTSVGVPPTLAEQQAIAEALSDADALVESLQQLIAKQHVLKQGAMQALLTGNKRLPGFTGEWQTRSLDGLFTFSGGFSASRDQLGMEGYCYLHYGDVHTTNKTVVDARVDFPAIPKFVVPLNRVSRSSLLDDGDVVFVDASEDEEGASKHVVVLNGDGQPFISGLHTIAAKPKGNALTHEYCRYCFQTAAVKGQFRFFAVGTKVLGVSKGNIGKIEILVPSREEQTAIATALSDMDAEIEALEARLAKTRVLKAGMMQQLLAGRIRLV